MAEVRQQNPVLVIGGGLAGCEAAWQLAERKVPVQLIDMKPQGMTPAHHRTDLAELVCSNSLRSNRLENAVGLLKEEMRRLGSLIVSCADETQIPAGGALAVDREGFSQCVTERINNHPLIERVSQTVTRIPDGDIVVIATGPLTEGDLFTDIRDRLGIETLYFFDAAAPIVAADSIDLSIVFRQSRYGRGSDDYLNCPMDKTQYQLFYDELIHARTADIHEFDQRHIFEGCMPVETMAQRGLDTLRFGPMKPVGLTDPKTGRQPYACVQLRQDDRQGQLYNLVGFQTRLAFSEQKRVFGLIPGLEKAEWIRFGVMHRNTFLPSPDVLNRDFSVRGQPGLYFAGQITGVEGYVESAASGLVTGRQAAFQAQGMPILLREERLPSAQTVIGALSSYISDPAIRHFQPMNANFGLLPRLETQDRLSKQQRIERMIQRSLDQIENLLAKDR